MNIQHEISESIDVEKSSSSIVLDKKLEAISSSTPKYTIFKVHSLLRRKSELDYEPEIVAIGPYHRGKDRLRVMEDQKLRWLKLTLEQLGQSDATKYIEAMKRLEPKARECYSESTEHINKDEFAEMLLLDACFIIHFIRYFMRDNLTSPFFKDWNINSSIRDILLFDNQIPLFVLEEVFSMIKRPNDNTDHFHQFPLFILVEFMKYRYRFRTPILENQWQTLSYRDKGNDIKHMLGLAHYVLCVLINGKEPVVERSKASVLARLCNLQHVIELCERGFNINRNTELSRCDQPLVSEVNLVTIPNAAKLHAAGVEFRRKKVRSNPFEITFKNGVMEIPILDIDDKTESLYRNLIAYEQYSIESINYCVCFHARLMDCLIDSAEDVALLVHCRVLVNGLGNDEAVSNMFNRLVREVLVPLRPSNAELFMNVNEYYRKKRHRWIAKLRRDYFSNPWAWISFIAAFLLLMLTLTQTVFSIIGAV